MGLLDSRGNGNKISHGMGMGTKCIAMGIKTRESLHIVTSTCNSACVSVVAQSQQKNEHRRCR